MTFSPLFFRLDVARIHLPALQERGGDITLIADHTIRDLNLRLGV